LLNKKLIITKGFITYGIVGMPIGIEFENKQLHIGDKVLVENTKKNKTVTGFVVIIGSNITVTGANNIPITKLKVKQLKSLYSNLKQGDAIYENDLMIEKVKY